jgi:tetratricopeptide (TPR) repeat protein
MGRESKTQRATTQPAERGGTPSESSRKQGAIRVELLWVLPALALGFLVYLNTLHGEFVYDDHRQIVRNTLIQDSSQFWRALTSDVWAFKGGDEAVSNYWRPSFVFWMVLNFRWFGLAPFGWHLTNILLHLAIVALAFAFLRRLKVSRPVAGAIALIFAVHPVHTESVAWVSGAPDLILCAALLGSMWFVNLLGEKQTPLRWGLAIALYLVALGAKEIAVFYPLIVVALLWQRERADAAKDFSWARKLSMACPFAAMAVAYVIVRHSIVGIAGRMPEGGASLAEAILTAPSLLSFYLRQIIVPIWIGPSYPLRTVTMTGIGLGNFVIPLVVTIAAGAWMIMTAARSKLARIGLTLFLVSLLPTLNITVFHPEQLVHDRYLYAPLLGFLMLAIPVIASLFERLGGEHRSRGLLLFLFSIAVISVSLAAQSVRYNRAWTSNLALWEWGVRSDPASSFNYQQYGVQLQGAGRLEQAADAFNRSIEINPAPVTYVARATTLIALKRFAEAERDLHTVTSSVTQVDPYTLYQAYERLAVSLTQQHKLNEAAESIVEARGRLPHYAAALTEKLAVVLYLGGQKQEALDELNAVRVQGRTETLPESRLIFYRLGLLHAGLKHPQEARQAFQEFLSLTQGMLTPDIVKARSQAEITLRNLGR